MNFKLRELAHRYEIAFKNFASISFESAIIFCATRFHKFIIFFLFVGGPPIYFQCVGVFSGGLACGVMAVAQALVPVSLESVLLERSEPALGVDVAPSVPATYEHALQVGEVERGLAVPVSEGGANGLEEPVVMLA